MAETRIPLDGTNHLRRRDLLGGLIHEYEAAYARLRAAAQLAQKGGTHEAHLHLERALAFYRSVEATRYMREGQALLAASA
ncbi:MAG: hypothetical protein ABR583_09095 [Gaiellaceae bacterium]